MTERLEKLRKLAADWLAKKIERDDADRESQIQKNKADNARQSLDRMQKEFGEFVGAIVRSRLITADGQTVVIHWRGDNQPPEILHYDREGQLK